MLRCAHYQDPFTEIYLPWHPITGWKHRKVHSTQANFMYILKNSACNYRRLIEYSYPQAAVFATKVWSIERPIYTFGRTYHFNRMTYWMFCVTFLSSLLRRCPGCRSYVNHKYCVIIWANFARGLFTPLEFIYDEQRKLTLSFCFPLSPFVLIHG